MLLFQTGMIYHSIGVLSYILPLCQLRSTLTLVTLEGNGELTGITGVYGVGQSAV
jgi:hypothetical protein